MSILDQLLSIIRPAPIVAASPEQPSTNLSNPENWLIDWGSGGRSNGYGPAITPNVAMSITAVHRCVTLRAGVVAAMPLKVFRRTSDGREEVTNHPVARMFKSAPHPKRPQTAFAWREALMMHLDLFGNSFSILRYDGAARVIGLHQVNPSNVEVREQADGRIIYAVNHDGSDRREIVQQEDMLHVAGPAMDSILGVSKIAYGRDALALAKVLETQTAVAHENAALPSGILTLPKLALDALKRIKAQFDSAYTGTGTGGKVMYLDDGSKFESVKLTPVDLATLESRRFSIAEIGRLFGVPLNLIMETEKSTSWGSGLAEQNLGWLCHSLNSDLSRIEAAVNRTLLGGDLYAEFERLEMISMDPEKQASVMQTEISNGMLTINEARRAKNRVAIKHGDEPLINSTNVPLERQINPPAPPPAAAPAPPEKTDATP